MDIGQCINGYIYHTKYDAIDVIPRESLQNTGDNALNLIRGFANATELYNTEVSTSIHRLYKVVYVIISFTGTQVRQGSLL